MAPASFFALLVIAVSFLPVLTLESQEGRMFTPLAYTKTLTMLVAAVLVITLDPALRVLLTRVRRFEFRPAWLCRATNAVIVGRIRSEESHPISRFLMRMYEPVVRWSLRWKWSVIGGAAALVVVTVPVFTHLGSEFMPPLDEGSLFYMPTTMPGISIGEAQKLLQVSDRAIKQFPEVDRVLGKAGRADTSTDPAPLSMLETVITLKPTSEWRRVDTWYSGWAPEWMKRVLRHVTPDHISAGAADRGDERGADVSRRFERLDDADQGADRHADDRDPHAGRAEDLRRRFRRDREDRHGDRGGAPRGERHAQRVRGAHRQRVLPRHRMEPRRARAATG